ncbi:unnamed protein product [Allacma fusca]|uniref:SAM-dependent MTase TRM10-type domain-containing protein n=1 Tax=Allacma fusca TaxID=39272 RepID=A0A8J2LV20_9HEXA|nr:unnamed protein product [Allacma fusca]
MIRNISLIRVCQLRKIGLSLNLQSSFGTARDSSHPSWIQKRAQNYSDLKGFKTSSSAASSVGLETKPQIILKTEVVSDNLQSDSCSQGAPEEVEPGPETEGVETLDIDVESKRVPVAVSKNKLRKSRKYLKRVEQRKEKRVLEKSKRKESNREKGAGIHRKFRGNDEKLLATEKLKRGLEIGPRVVIDCQFEERMSEKEQKRFAQQIRRVYSSNRVAENPLHLYLTSLGESSPLFKICCQLNSGFEQYVIDRTGKSVTELFTDVKDEVVYLSPDAKVELEEFHPGRIYVVGGIVDETTRKNISRRFAQGSNISSARIPIDKYFSKSETGTFKKVLTINQVIDIVIEWHRSKDWVQAIQAGLPKRTGFVPAESGNK